MKLFNRKKTDQPENPVHKLFKITLWREFVPTLSMNLEATSENSAVATVLRDVKTKYPMAHVNAKGDVIFLEQGPNKYTFTVIGYSAYDVKTTGALKEMYPVWNFDEVEFY